MSQPNALHKNIFRPNYLTVGQQNSLGLIIVFAFLTTGFISLALYFGLSAPWSFQLRNGITAFKLQLLTGLVALLMLLISIGLSFMERPPRTFQVQTYALWPRIIWNLLGALLFLLVAATLLMMVKEYYRTTLATLVGVSEDLKAIRKLKVFTYTMTFLILLVGGLVVIWLSRTGLRNLRTFWRQVRLTGYFNQEVYRPGDQVKFILKDRQSLNGTHRYRAHLNFVVEEYQGRKDTRQLVREIQHSAFKDCLAGDLHTGITFKVPDAAKEKKQYTKFSNRELHQYWEILIESEAPYFFARFFVNVAGVKRLP